MPTGCCTLVDEDVKVFIDWFTSGVAEKSKALKKMAKVFRYIIT